MNETYIKIIYNEDNGNFEAWKHSGHAKDFIYMDDDAEELVEMITDDVDELKASC